MNYNKVKDIQVVSYNFNWPHDYKQESKNIKNALSENYTRIHHVGSTSVEGLAAKPIIDIVVVVKNGELSIKPLEAIGYSYKGEFNIPFKYLYTKRNEAIKVNLHVYEGNHFEIELNIKFRDYLRQKPEKVIEYKKLKLELLSKEESFKKDNSIFTGYNLGKDKFIKEALQEAGFDKIRFLYVAHNKKWEAYHRIRKKQLFEPINVVYDPNHPSIFAENCFHFILCHGVKVASVAMVELLSDNVAVLRSLATDEPYKGKGFGSKMLIMIEKWVKSKGRNIIKTHAAKRAEGFYRKLRYNDMEFDDIPISKDVVDLGKIL